MAKREPSIDFLHRLLSFDHTTGLLRWKERTPDLFKATARTSAETICARWNGKHAGRVLSNIDRKGYIRLQIAGRWYLAHRVVWAMVHGAWPSCEIDHRDGNRQNNRPGNLRLGPPLINGKNLARYSTNTSGVVGVVWNRTAGRWQAQIVVNKTLIYLGLFDSVDQAASVRKAAERHHDFTPRHGSVAAEQHV